MVNRKSKARQATTAVQAEDSANTENVMLSSKPGFFPYARYTSVVGVHTTLLLFAALFLPQSTILFADPVSSQLTSRDRPQHPFLNALTMNPVATVACICAGSVILQGWWGGWVRNWWIDYSLEGSEVEKVLERGFVNQRKFIGVRNAWAASIAASFAVHFLLVLFGAPIASYVLHTYLLALLVSILIVFTPAYILGIPSFASDTPTLLNRLTWVRLFAEFSIRNPVERAIVYPTIGVVLGCWAGAFPIALDWDRPWQAWPLTPAFGAVLGYILGSISAFTVSATKFLAEEHIRSQHVKHKTS